ncbi:restriction endonuclease subunit M [Antarcticibacterium flavum]|uniref:site-specific DNA-methyltransferase (adenine-specific) n=1 Tax=Antarcticibacterium flavum TaxID=2058175 RepID=A0A5B7X174_9FLAO|nr:MULTISPECIES: N-6 DNA methylase [Antarcticibacterium]MCM4161726.1 restriction endonuclease subunit M [Antarcticibacterium sp. W02-3]QCY68371.1 restriction endonuclease subunit M [Antarcticibacterium flavum]
MALFQVSVLKNYLRLQDDQVVDKAYKEFTSYFQHPEIQENIRKSKEEEFQAIFLNELFVKILGYTLKPNPGYDLSTEFKNESNNRKADGAILKDRNAIGVIELKGTNTKHLEGIRQQAFDYKANQKHCVYVITSNFEKLRFYIQDATEFLEFDLFELNREDFGLLWLCLSKENILKGLPLKIKEASLGEEEEITKEFYKDYSLFKRELFRDLVQRNVERLKDGLSGYESDAHDPETEAEKEIKLNLFKKSQKLIDRFLFIFFAEDRGLLPPNAIVNILSEWNQLKDLDAEIPLYDRFKQYFGYLNHGRPATETRPEIYAYNGGLFKPDELLDGLGIDDKLLHKHTSKLAKYDFESQVDVNILGHIFENSLNEIESVSAEIEGGEFDKQKSKRKKDGVFYTPKYITKYIVENTIGRLCEEKKSELGFREEEYFKGRKRRQKDTLEALVKILDDYRDWLLQLTICDPACGSGAFLNQALDFLIKEHRYIDEMKAKLLGGSLILSDIENTILERNIYGVDINEESVEIAKLSLWLRTAQPSRKLNDLSGNIKCGNSLIDDEAVAGNKAFKWEEEFPEVFDPSSGSGGGFDVVIGNPPWGAKLSTSEANFLIPHYPEVPTKLKDTYMYFMLAALKQTKKNGYIGLIVPNTWLLINNTADFRLRLLNLDVLQIIDHGDDVFEDAIVESSTILLRNQVNLKGEVSAQKIRNNKLISDQILPKEIWINDELHRIVLELKIEAHNLIKKLETVSKPFDAVGEIIFGIKPYQVGHGIPPQTREMVNNRIYHSTEKLGDDWFPLVTGTDVNRYSLVFNNDAYIKYGKWLMYSSNEEKIKEKKILLRRTSHDLRAVLDFEQHYPQNSLFVITSKLNLNYLLALFNSRLFDYVYKAKCPQVGKIFAEVKPSIIKSMPIFDGNTDNFSTAKVEKLLFEQEKLNKLIQNLLNFFTRRYNIYKTTRKLQSWYDLEFGEFIKELNKAIKAGNKVRAKKGLSPIPELTKKDEFEWMELFEENKKKAVELQREIEKTDAEIDKVVYELYGLTEEEIEIVESK